MARAAHASAKALCPADENGRSVPETLEIIVHDTGKGFDLKSVNGNVTSTEHLMDLRGRGIYIMRACMDQVDWVFDDQGTTCRLIKRRPAPAQAG